MIPFGAKALVVSFEGFHNQNILNTLKATQKIAVIVTVSNDMLSILHMNHLKFYYFQDLNS